MGILFTDPDNHVGDLIVSLAGEVGGDGERRALLRQLGQDLRQQLAGIATQKGGDVGKGVKEQLLAAFLDVCERRAGQGNRTGDVFLRSEERRVERG